jgi:hypothetical protein
VQALTEDATSNHFETAKLFLSHGSRRDLKYKKTPDGVQALLEGLLIFQLLLVANVHIIPQQKLHGLNQQYVHLRESGWPYFVVFLI